MGQQASELGPGRHLQAESPSQDSRIDVFPACNPKTCQNQHIPLAIIRKLLLKASWEEDAWEKLFYFFV